MSTCCYSTLYLLLLIPVVLVSIVEYCISKVLYYTTSITILYYIRYYIELGNADGNTCSIGEYSRVLYNIL